MPEELREQVPLIKEMLAAMGINIMSLEGYEADDLLGTVARRSEAKGMDVTILSGDRDLLQLATDHVKIRIPKTRQGRTEVEDYYAADVKERYQVTPSEFIDLKALMGDSSDNIPGVPGIGEKTAAKIIVEYHSIENAHAHADELKPPRAANAMKEHWDLAVMSKELATINVNAEFSYELAEAKLENIYTEEAYAWFQKLQFKNLLNRFDVKAPSNKIEDYFHEIRIRKEAEAVFEKADGAACIGACIFKNKEEVLPLFADQAQIGGIGISFSKEDHYCIRTGPDLQISWLLEQLSRVAAGAERFAIFDLKSQLDNLKIQKKENCFDVTVAAYLLNPLKSNYDYEDVAREQLGLVIEEKSEEYVKVCYEAYTAFAASRILLDKLKETGMEELFTKIEMPLVFALYHMEKNGVRVNSDALKEYGDQLAVHIRALEKEIYEEAGETFNINSPKQLGVILFEKMQIPGGKKTKTGYSTAADVLEKLAPDHPIVSKILEYRQYAKLKSTYADGLAAYIGPDGRIHGKFNQTITATGRISSTEPNLQNIPVRTELGRMIRKVFVPEEGYVFVDADYSQIELRVLAHCSGDTHLIEAYREARDIHRITASQVFHVPFADVTDQQRRNAKAVNFGIVYGISSFGLSQDLSITRKEAAKYIDDYFQTYPGIKTFLDQAVQHAKDQGYAVTLFGRRRPVPELSSSNFMQRSFGERVAMNSPIQGTAADIIKIAMIGVDRRLKEEGLKSRLVLQVHDELLIEAEQTEVETVKEILRQEMEQAASLDVPLEIDMHTGDNWYEAK